MECTHSWVETLSPSAASHPPPVSSARRGGPVHPPVASPCPRVSAACAATACPRPASRRPVGLPPPPAERRTAAPACGCARPLLSGARSVSACASISLFIEQVSQ